MKRAMADELVEMGEKAADVYQTLESLGLFAFGMSASDGRMKKAAVLIGRARESAIITMAAVVEAAQEMKLQCALSPDNSPVIRPECAGPAAVPARAAALERAAA